MCTELYFHVQPFDSRTVVSSERLVIYRRDIFTIHVSRGQQLTRVYATQIVLQRFSITIVRIATRCTPRATHMPVFIARIL